MKETIDTKCPLCGAPATVTLVRNARGVQFEVDDYCYKEPEPAPAPTMYGYDLDHLRLVAELIRRHGVTPDDLQDLKDNFQRAFDILHAEEERMRKAAIDRALQNFQPDTFPDLSALNITREQFIATFNDDKEAEP